MKIELIGRTELSGRTDSEAEATILWPSHEKRRLPGKDPDVGKV